MSERFTLTIDGEDHELTEDNHTVALFRDTPEFDYIHLQPENDLTEEQRHILIFRHQRLCYWLAGLGLSGASRGELAEMNEELGPFRGMYGFNSKTMIEDTANDFEQEYYVESMLGDLRNAEGADDLLS